VFACAPPRAALTLRMLAGVTLSPCERMMKAPIAHKSHGRPLQRSQNSAVPATSTHCLLLWRAQQADLLNPSPSAVRLASQSTTSTTTQPQPQPQPNHNHNHPRTSSSGADSWPTSLIPATPTHLLLWRRQQVDLVLARAPNGRAFLRCQAGHDLIQVGSGRQLPHADPGGAACAGRP